MRTGINRLSVFFRLISLLGEDRGRHTLSLSLPKTDGIQMKRLNSILKFIADNYSRSTFPAVKSPSARTWTISFFALLPNAGTLPRLEYLNRIRASTSRARC